MIRRAARRALPLATFALLVFAACATAQPPPMPAATRATHSSSGTAAATQDHAVGVEPVVAQQAAAADERAQSSAGADSARTDLPIGLRVESQEQPLGLDTPHPRFSWKLTDARRGAVQSAFEIEVADISGPQPVIIWNSGRVISARTSGVQYPGTTGGAAALQPFQACEWRVRSFDGQGRPSAWSHPARFELGPLAPAGWGARWIGATAPAPPAPAGATAYHSPWHGAADDYAYVQIDFGAQMKMERLRLHRARLPDRTRAPFPLRLKVYVDDSPAFDRTFMKVAEHTWQDLPADSDEPFEISLGTRYSVRFVRVVVTSMPHVEGRGYGFALGELEVLDFGVNVAPLGIAGAHGVLEEPGWSIAGLNDSVIGGLTGDAAPEADATPGGEAQEGAQVRAQQGARDGAGAGARESAPAPPTVLRHEFDLPFAPQRATLHASALGLCEFELNGKLLDGQRLAPAWTDVRERALYLSLDATAALKQGRNVLIATLAPGWYGGRAGSDQTAAGAPREAGRPLPLLVAQLEVHGPDGQRARIASDGSWLTTGAGPVRAADLLDGETHDLRNVLRRAAQPGYDTASWRPARVAEQVELRLDAQRAPPVQVVSVLEPVGVSRGPEDSPIYDFGQDISGVVRLTAGKDAAPLGGDVRLRHAELLATDGSLHRANLLTAAQTDHCTLTGSGHDLFEPRFSVHGFRFVEVSGLERLPQPDEVRALALTTGVRDAGGFECSDLLLNKLWTNAIWTRRSNWVGLPTDSPQRDRRLGSLGEVLAGAGAALAQADLETALAQWLADVRAGQDADGRFADCAPPPADPAARTAGTPGWADAGVLLPWEHYLRYHDQQLLRASLPGAARWVDFVRARNKDLVWREQRGADRGDRLEASDWSADTRRAAGLPQEVQALPREVFASAFLARTTAVLARMARACGDEQQALVRVRQAQETAAAFRRAFVDGAGRIRGDAQGAYALALDFGLHASPAQAQLWADRLAERVREQGCLTTGIHTTVRALRALSRHGHHELALALVRRTEFPSWGWQAEQGATTAWERWDGRTLEGLFQDPATNSFNHFASAAFAEWLVSDLAGIQLAEELYAVEAAGEAAGAQPWSRFHLRPQVGAGLSSARAWHEAAPGRIESAWRLEGEGLVYECVVPPNARAWLELPARALEDVREGGRELAQSPGLSAASASGGRFRCELAAGRYRFSVARR